MMREFDLGGVRLELHDRGSGAAVLFLHGFYGPAQSEPFVTALASRCRVVAPTHPGFAHSELPAWIDSVDDLAYLYRALIRELGLSDVVIVGASLGGWIAAEMATKCTYSVRGLVLIDAFGVKFGGRESRDIADVYAMRDDDLARALHADPDKALRPSTFSDDQLEAFVRSREASALYMWQPYAHNPKLLRRLHLIDVPTLVLWGAGDGIVSPAYGRLLAESIAGATFETIPLAGHFAEVDQPELLASRIGKFFTQIHVTTAV